jgi:cellulose synthase/poly-beta-1,6-N-acetylglucosamine synthase-like glycosyltransferase
LDYPLELAEVILVDNNSSDETARFSIDVWNNLNSKFRFRLVKEKQQGKNFALKRGVLGSNADFVVICDDDNWLDPKYLKTASDVLSANSCIGALGGQGIPVCDVIQMPNWFYTFANNYAVGIQAICSGDLTTARGYLWGAGLIIRRELLADVFLSGYDSILTCRKGDELTSGGDSELCKWVILAGYRLWYEENLIFHHFIPKSRLTLDYLVRLNKGLAESGSVLNFYDQYIHIRSMRRFWYKSLLRWLWSEFRYISNLSHEKKRVVELAKKVECLAKSRIIR